MTENNIPHWLEEFGEEYRPEEPILHLMLQDGVVDFSWHNDACPHIGYPIPGGQLRVVELWFQHPERSHREVWPEFRYMVCVSDKDLYDVDNRRREFDDAAAAVIYFMNLVVEYANPSK